MYLLKRMCGRVIFPNRFHCEDSVNGLKIIKFAVGVDRPNTSIMEILDPTYICNACTAFSQILGLASIVQSVNGHFEIAVDDLMGCWLDNWTAPLPVFGCRVQSLAPRWIHLQTLSPLV